MDEMEEFDYVPPRLKFKTRRARQFERWIPLTPGACKYCSEVFVWRVEHPGFRIPRVTEMLICDQTTKRVQAHLALHPDPTDPAPQ